MARRPTKTQAPARGTPTRAGRASSRGVEPASASQGALRAPQDRGKVLGVCVFLALARAQRENELSETLAKRVRSYEADLPANKQ